MNAVADATPTKQRYPLVVIAQGNGQSVVDQCSLAESLVGYGFVVATCPSSTRVFPLKDESELARCAEQQADDIAMLVGQVSRRKDVDASRIGVVGHSLGARGGLFFAMRDHRVRTLISLDGGIGTLTGRTVMLASASFRWRAFGAKVFHFYETLDSFMKPDFALLRDLSGQTVQVARVPDMHHVHFTSLGAWIGSVPGLLEATHGLPASEAGMGTAQAYERLSASVRDILRRTLAPASGQPTDVQAASPWAPGSPHAAFEFESLPRAHVMH
jgi:dienelactone hydrolase